MPNTLQSPPQQVQNGVSDDLLITAHAAMLAGRHFNQQASNLAKQGYMGAYPQCEDPWKGERTSARSIPRLMTATESR